MNGQKPYEKKDYYALALDPIHVGTGGYRLGEVDLTIVREPGTHLPKIPGSSLAGAARAYTAMRHPEKYRREDDRPQKESFNTATQAIEPSSGAERKAKKKEYISCAGKGGADGSEHCGKIDCPVCVTYGFTIGPENRSFHGLAQFYDAHILFFPVHSMVGPVWVTAPGVLHDAGYELPPGQRVSGHQIRLARPAADQGPLVPQREGRTWGLNLGWLFLSIAGADLDTEALWRELKLPQDLGAIRGRLVLVSDELFSLVVDSNLEVRTSVAIDPATGAAEEGGLFTYEALPRGTVLRFSVVYHNPQFYVFPARGEKKGEVKPTPFPASQGIQWLQDNVWAGLELMEYLGVGGMSTRGFGRLRVREKGAQPAPPPGQTEGGE